MEPQDKVVTSKELSDELKNAPPQKFFESGNPFLDYAIGGFAEGDLIIVGGSPKAGKTTLLQTWTRQFALRKIPCLWFSVELSNREFLKRFGKDLPIFWLPRIMPINTTHVWIENKIIEAKKKHDIKIAFIDHIGIVTDEQMYRERNSVDILDARLFRLKRFAIQQKLCLVVVAPFVSTTLRKKKSEPSTGDFRGTAMMGYTADTLLAIDRLIGTTVVKTLNDEYSDVGALAGGYEINSDAYLYILDCRRTGIRKVRVKMKLDESGNLVEA